MSESAPDKWLDAFDAFSAYLCRSCRKAPARGNHFLVVLDFDRAPDPETVRTFFRELPPLPRILFGRVKRAWDLAPYRTQGVPRPVPVSTAREGDTPERFANEPLPPGVPFDCRVFSRMLAFRFSHLMFDGFGAERFLHCLFTGGIPPEQGTGLLSDPHMNDWKQQMRRGTEFRNLLLDPALPSAACLLAEASSANRFLTCSFEADPFLEDAEKTAGPFMLIPHLLNRVSLALRPILSGLGIEGDFVVPMTVDRRGQEDHPKDALFFNHWSMMPVRIPAAALRSGDAFPEIRRAFYQANARKLPELFRQASFPGRFAPYFLMRFLERRYGNFLGGTFLFSLLNESGLAGKAVLGHEVRNIRHFPLMPARPGLGIFFNRAGKYFNLTVSIRTGLLPEDAADRFFHILSQGAVES